MRPYYRDDYVTLYNADYRDVTVDPFDLLLTDVPYNVSQRSNGLRELDYGSWDRDFDIEYFLRRTFGIYSPASCYVWCHETQLSYALLVMREEGLIDRPLAWLKPNPTVINGQRLWLPGLELCAFGKQRGALFNEHCHPGYWITPPDSMRLHPNQKPLSVVTDQVRASTERGNVVYDPFAGSGTTLVAAKSIGRRAIGVELSEEYCEVTASRLSQEVLELFSSDAVSEEQPELL